MAASGALAASRAAGSGLTRDQLLELYYYMRLTRSLEERLVNLYRQTKVVGGLFRSLGQEADAVGSAYALDRSKGDVLSPLIRNLGPCWCRAPLRWKSCGNTWPRATHPPGAAS